MEREQSCMSENMCERKREDEAVEMWRNSEPPRRLKRQASRPVGWNDQKARLWPQRSKKCHKKIAHHEGKKAESLDVSMRSRNCSLRMMRKLKEKMKIEVEGMYA
mmetsp:Transcript_18071/g.31172  ORF Transcript_18071/g.31172 Transcript_18071/m.31172 type:complete len:105 (-) Transcript_18071:669-983(-)